MTRLFVALSLAVVTTSAVSAQCCDAPVYPSYAGAGQVISSGTVIDGVTYGTPVVSSPSVGGLPSIGGLPGGGLLSSLNAPLVPGLPAVPGMPSLSVLGLVAPRLSIFSSFLSMGGFSGPNTGLYLVGFAAPRVAPVLALQQGLVSPGQAVLGTVAPRLAVGARLVQNLPAIGSGIGSGGGLGLCRGRNRCQ